MDCEKMEDHLFEFMDDCLASSDRGTLSHHLQGCPDCRMKLEDFLRLRASVKFSKAMDPAPMPDRDFSRLVMSRLEREEACVPPSAVQTFVERMREMMAPLREGWLVPAVALVFLLILPLGILGNLNKDQEGGLPVPGVLNVAENQPQVREKKPLPDVVVVAGVEQKKALPKEQDTQQMELEEYLKVHSQYASEPNIPPVSYVNY